MIVNEKYLFFVFCIEFSMGMSNDFLIVVEEGVIFI